MNLIYKIGSKEACPDVSGCGGKGMNLIKLSRFGFRVPEFIVITTEVFDLIVKGFGEEYEKAILRSPVSVRELFSPENISAELKNDLINEVKKCFSPDDLLAVRSSAVDEDSKDFSHAGQLDSFLYVINDDEIIDYILKTFASVFSDRAFTYRNMKGVSHKDVKTAVVVQKMIYSRISGVTFTVNPLSRRVDEIMINAVYGLGEGIVSGLLSADSVICGKGKNMGILSKTPVRKNEMLIFDSINENGTVKTGVEEKFRNSMCIDDVQIIRLAETCRDIEKNYGCVPQDIEWTVNEENELYILQSRPITTLDKIIPSSNDRKTVWDNSNIVESYSGITLPLTFSFALNAYHMVYVQFCEVLKVPRKKIIENDFYFSNMLGLLNGRVYYNIINWCRLISMLPGYNYNRKFMEQMMGVKEEIAFVPEDHGSKSFTDKYFIELPRLLWSGINLFYQFMTIERRVKKFMGIYNESYNKYKDHDFYSDNAHELVLRYKDLENNVLRNWKAPIINDFMAMIYYGVLKTLIKKWKIDEENESLDNKLVSGQGNVESVLPMKMLQEIAGMIRSEKMIADEFSKLDETDLITKYLDADLKSLPDKEREIGTKLKEYLEEYGFRSMNELKLEVPTLHENPAYIFTIIKNYLRFEARANESGAEDKLRIEAENKVWEKLKFKPFKKIIFKFVLKNTKKAVSFREYQRFARTKMFGISRRIFLAIGQRFVELQIIKERDDIFYLTMDEIFSFIYGASPMASLSELIELRKKQYKTYEKSAETPDRIETWGTVPNNDYYARLNQNEDDGDPDTLRGISCCPGIVRKKVKVIINPTDDMSLDGEILVAARTDPGWVMLYPSASGLLIERGSILSHSAIVSREIGLPSILGIPGVTTRLKTGDVVEMDGAKGTVKIIERIKED